MSPDKPIPKNIDEYIANFPSDIHAFLEEMCSSIRNVAPQATETISYRMPPFVLHGNLVHFSAYKNHIGFYPTPSGIVAFKEELSGFVSAKGSVSCES